MCGIARREFANRTSVLDVVEFAYECIECMLTPATIGDRWSDREDAAQCGQVGATWGEPKHPSRQDGQPGDIGTRVQPRSKPCEEKYVEIQYEVENHCGRWTPHSGPHHCCSDR